jgi:MFS family permease
VQAVFATSAWQMAAGQLLNAASAGLGITLMQDMLPRHAGHASTLLSNAFSAGAVLAGPILGVAQHVGYRASYVAASLLGAAGLLLMALRGRAATRPSRAVATLAADPVEVTLYGRLPAITPIAAEGRRTLKVADNHGLNG